MYIYCDCLDSKGQLNLRRANNGQNQMMLVKTCENGLCEHCDNIPLINKEEIKIERVSKYNIYKNTLYIKKYLKD